MATLSINNPTLLDLAKASDPDGKIAMIVELLSQTNEVLDDMSWMEGNLPTGHRTTVRTGLPGATWRAMYQFVQPSKAETVQVTDNTGMLEAYSEIDKALADLNGNTAAFRLSEDMAQIEAMNQEMARTIFYGNEGTEPASFTGLAPRFNAHTNADNSENVFNQGDSSNLQSIWLVNWGPNTVHGIIPKGSTAGLNLQDLGEVTVEGFSSADQGGRYQAYRTHYRWDAGLTVRDWRYICRICNIDKTISTDAQHKELLYNLFRAVNYIPQMGMGRPVWYMSRDMLVTLRQAISERTRESMLTMENVGGVMAYNFMGIPLRRVDALAANETAVGA